MLLTADAWVAHLLDRVRQIRRSVGIVDPDPVDGEMRFADVLDSMAMVEFLTLLASDCGVDAEVIEACVGRQFGNIAQLAEALNANNVSLSGGSPAGAVTPTEQASLTQACWLAATAVGLPEAVQPAVALDEALGRPAGWFERHAGIRERRVWAGLDPVATASGAARACLERTGVLVEEIGALFVTSEAPPVLSGLGATLHDRLELLPTTPVFEVNNACTGFLAACRLAQALLGQARVVLVVAVEAPSFHLSLQPGPAGESAALFGDGAAACILTLEALGPDAVAMGDIVLGVEGRSAPLVQVGAWPVEVRLEGRPLAQAAVRHMARSVRGLAGRWSLTAADLAGVVAHGGNGRVPAVLARHLGLPPEQVWSTTPWTGNLGSASLPAAWALCGQAAQGPVVWTSVGAGLLHAATLTRRVHWQGR